MRTLILAGLALVVAAPVVTPATAQSQRVDREDVRREQREARDTREEWRDQRRSDWRQNDRRQRDWRQYRRFDYNRVDPSYGYYEPEYYYRDARYYRERRLTRADRIYRGNNGRYYCRRNDGTTGLIVGGVGGAVFGDAIAPRGSRTLGALLGGVAGAALGRELSRGNLRCR